MDIALENLKALLVLNLLGQRRQVVDWLEQGIAPAEALDRLPTQRAPSAWGERCLAPSGFNPEKEIERCEKLGARLVTWFDFDYSKLLKEIHDPPLVLYIKGSFEENDAAGVAIVGTRFPSIYGIEQAKRFGRELAGAGLTIVSGFAKGIDQAAHAGALEVTHGRTLAVLGCGIDIDYPRGSRKLFDRIAEHGAMISEYPIGTEPRAEFFPRRNRVISGLTLGTLVIEAALKSGSLITAHSAAEQGRDVFALPGLVGKPNSAGCHYLIKEGAGLVESPLDILEALGIQLRCTIKINQVKVASHQPHISSSPHDFRRGSLDVDSRLRACGNDETKHGNDTDKTNNAMNDTIDPAETSLLKILHPSPLTFDELAEASGLAVPVLWSLLLLLELQRKICKSPDGRFLKN